MRSARLSSPYGRRASWAWLAQAIREVHRGRGPLAQWGQDERGGNRLSWVELVPALLRQPALLRVVEQEARDLWERGIRHVIWAGMGGSIRPVEVLYGLGIGQQAGGMRLYLLQSTDPRAVNEVVRAIAQAKQIELPTDRPLEEDEQRHLLEDVLLVSVALSTTSAEPLTHLVWFLNALRRARLDPQPHVLVLALAGSLLEKLAGEHALPTRSPFLTRYGHVEGRMSAPGTRVFLLPIALHLAAEHASGFLETILRQAWSWYDLELAEHHPERHAFVQLAVALFRASEQGCCRLLLELPAAWQPLFSWIEQLLEQSTGKEGKGLLVFPPQRLQKSAPGYRAQGLLRVQAMPDPPGERVPGTHILGHPSLAALSSSEVTVRLAGVAAQCLGWQLTMALYAVLAQIPFAGEPAVERSKAWTQRLLAGADPVTAPHDASLFRLSEGQGAVAAIAIAQQLVRLARQGTLAYFDLTFNGQASKALHLFLKTQCELIGPLLCGVPAKLRYAPQAYHLSEQAQLDGPDLLSLRIVIDSPPASMLLGRYSPLFFRAQAVGTWKAMREVDRVCFLLVVKESQMPFKTEEALCDFFAFLLTSICSFLTRKEGEQSCS